MKITTKVITRSALILALTIVVQSIRLPQFITGPLVNAFLFLAAALIGPISAVLIGLCTPVIAFAFGIMPLAPAVPVIMLGNAALALVYGKIAVYGKLSLKPYLGVAAAALAKYAVMALSVFYLLPWLVNVTLPAKVATTLTTPQVFTALAGGVVALAVLKGLSLLKKDKETDAGTL